MLGLETVSLLEAPVGERLVSKEVGTFTATASGTAPSTLLSVLAFLTFISPLVVAVVLMVVAEVKTPISAAGVSVHITSFLSSSSSSVSSFHADGSSCIDCRCSADDCSCTEDGCMDDSPSEFLATSSAGVDTDFVFVVVDEDVVADLRVDTTPTFRDRLPVFVSPSSNVTVSSPIEQFLDEPLSLAPTVAAEEELVEEVLVELLLLLLLLLDLTRAELGRESWEVAVAGAVNLRSFGGGWWKE